MASQHSKELAELITQRDLGAKETSFLGWNAQAFQGPPAVSSSAQTLLPWPGLLISKWDVSGATSQGRCGPEGQWKQHDQLSDQQGPTQ